MLERTVLLDGFSKTYAMTGWRCGYAAVPETLVEPLTRFFVNSTSCVPPFVQHAGVAALTGPQDDVRAMVAEFAARRDLVVDGLNALPGVSCLSPRGAFYVFPNVAGTPVERRRARRPAARGGRRGRAGRHRLRRAGRRPPAAVLRELPGEPHARARADGRLPRRPVATERRGRRRGAQSTASTTSVASSSSGSAEQSVTARWIAMAVAAAVGASARLTARRTPSTPKPAALERALRDPVGDEDEAVRCPGVTTLRFEARRLADPAPRAGWTGPVELGEVALEVGEVAGRMAAVDPRERGGRRHASARAPR